jgi:prepilin-type N-terminal cleavage/methylation domain-containing protein
MTRPLDELFKKGFTLVELLVVLVVIGVIAGLILPNTLRAIEEANERECISNLRSIDAAIKLCYATVMDATQCDTMAELNGGTGQFLETVPVCPFSVNYAIAAATDAVVPTTVTKNTHFASWPPRGIDHQ